jgi:hypothetical protein
LSPRDCLFFPLRTWVWHCRRTHDLPGLGMNVQKSLWSPRDCLFFSLRTRSGTGRAATILYHHLMDSETRAIWSGAMPSLASRILVVMDSGWLAYRA